MIKAVVSNGFIKNRISAASKKVQEKRTAALFNATASWRREGDLNPRTGITRLLVFEASPFSLLGTSPYFNHSFIMLAQAKPFCKEFLI